ncbi:TPA: signal recognition particle-docking protein FtsY, partial [Pseudomonas aeruginosa]|nr:signal recognition particle-docking protein FtsY [Pseudomonas aeruginosa]EKW8695001.1 signal recognition particle-docking protein FtsY [Pseudomonas aeruginosa]ELT8144574.1 signal recognition particle-docking protein FtsY [Pseudomonas aeruginosa]MCT4809960.1 signal recognition particle-docking protein FtsY [Pseudomonas aeruginosa]HBO1451507.1 signal recognition particle-docking protein FtsY [Pseudomonas aeruginosa]
MFGSNDDKKAPQGGEKKGLFGWWRKKPQAGEQPADQPVEPVSETAAAEQRAPADDVAQSLTEQPGRQQPSAAEPAEPPAPVAEAPLAGDEPASAEEHSPRPEAPVAQPEP